MAADTVTIYGLIDPRTSELRYIGQTVNLIWRARHHVKPVALRVDTERGRWLRELCGVGLRPEVVDIEVVPSPGRYEAEAFWIAYFRSIGASLTNGSRIGVRHTPEARDKIRAARAVQGNPRIGTTHSEESRRKMRASWARRKRAQQT